MMYVFVSSVETNRSTALKFQLSGVDLVDICTVEECKPDSIAQCRDTP